MARLTLYPPVLHGSVNGWTHRVSFKERKIATVATDAEGRDTTVDAAGFSFDIPVHALAIQIVECGMNGYGEDAEPRELAFYCMVFDVEHEDRLRSLAPLGYIVEPWNHKDAKGHVCLRVCELFLMNEWDRLRMYDVLRPENGGYDYHKRHAWPHMDEDAYNQMDSKIRQLIAPSNLHQIMQVKFERNTPADRETIIYDNSQRVSMWNGYGSNHLKGIAVYDARYTHLPARSLPEKPLTEQVLDRIRRWEQDTELRPTQTFDKIRALANNHAEIALARTRRALDVAGVKNRNPPASGRRVNLDEDLPRFPDATRCTVGANEQAFLVFGINADRGTYHAVNGPVGMGGWNKRDFMLIHRDTDSWRFIFWCYYDLHMSVCVDTRGVMIVPYIVHDSECARHPSQVTAQRGMPLAITKAINETPYCAAAISHGLSRLRYIRSKVKVFNEPMGKNADLHHPEFSALFRSAPGGSTLAYETHRGVSKKAIGNNQHRADRALKSLVEGLRGTRTEWTTQVETPMTSILGAGVHTPRAVVLDM